MGAAFDTLNPFAPSGGYSLSEGIGSSTDPGVGSVTGPAMSGPPAPQGPGTPGGPFTILITVLLAWLLIKYLAEERFSGSLTLSHIRPSLYNMVVIWMSWFIADHLIKWVVNTAPIRSSLPALPGIVNN